MEKKASYVLSTYSFLSTHSLDDLLNVGNQLRNGNPIPSFDENLLIDLCSEAQEIFETEENILKINDDLVVVGDIHGSFHDLLRILKFIVQTESKVLFLGDYVDRGNFSLECITLLFALKVMYPDMVYLLRGNHEFDQICSQYGFKNEILSYNSPNRFNEKFYEKCTSDSQCDNCYQYTESLYNAFIRAFSYLPIGAIVNETTFCIHGGLSPKLNLIDDINIQIKRPIDTFEENSLLSDLVWSDPSNHLKCQFERNPRGYGYIFNREATYNFINDNSIKRVIRAHQCVLNGVVQHFDERCITVFSVSSYAESFGNNSAVIQLLKDDSFKVTTFESLYHLSKSDAYFYKVQPLNQLESKNRVCFNILHPRLPLATPTIITPNDSSKRIKLHLKKNPLTSSVPKFVTNQRKSVPFLKNSVQLCQHNSSE